MTLIALKPDTGEGSSPAVPADRCQPQRVLVVDEHELIRAGLRALLLDEPWVETCLVADSAELAWQVVRRHHPQMVLVSTSLGGRSGLQLCRALKQRMPHVRAVVMSGEGRVSAAQAIQHGAVASFSKQMPTRAIAEVLQRAAEGGRVYPRDAGPSDARLSGRELDILQQLAAGLSNREVAQSLCLSRHTVKQHASAVYRKLGAKNRAQAASFAQELGLLA